MTSVDLRRITLRHGRRVVVRDLSLTIDSGAQIALCGPADSGVFDLVRALIGIDQINDGALLFDDDDVTTTSPRRRDVCLVLPEHPLLDRRTVEQNLGFARRGHGSDRTDLADDIQEAADALGIGDLLQTPARSLDPSQQQRVALARALVRDAALTVFDDAFSAIEGRDRAHLRGIISEWQRASGATSVYATPDPAEALAVADTVVIMHQGAIAQVGSAHDVYSAPADLFVATYTGEMNLMPARRDDDMLVTGLFDLALDDGLRAALGEREEFILGFRPHDVTMADAQQIDAKDGDADQIVIDADTDEVDWHGGSQALLFELDLDDWVDDLAALETTYGVHLFDESVMAWVAPSPRRNAGDTVRLILPRGSVVLFDLVTGETLGP